MAFDRTKLPKPVQEILARLEAGGAHVHVAEIKIDGETVSDTPKVIQDALNMLSGKNRPSPEKFTVESETTSQTSSPGSTDEDEDEDEDDDNGPQQFVDTLVEIMKDGLGTLHGHLCPRIKENKRRIETLEREARDARKDIDELKRQLAARTAG